MDQRETTTPPTAAKGSNKGALGCLLAGVLLFGGCTAYFAIDGASKDAGSATPAATQPAAPATTAESPAQRLADLDNDPGDAGAYQAALDALAPKCTQDEAFIAGLGDSGYNDLAKNGITDETRLTVLQHLNDSIPASMGKTGCTSMLSAYLVLREQG